MTAGDRQGRNYRGVLKHPGNKTLKFAAQKIKNTFPSVSHFVHAIFAATNYDAFREL